MKKIPIILGVVFLVTVIANAYFLNMPYYNGTYLATDGDNEESITFNDNVATGSLFFVGTVRESDGEIKVRHQDLYNPKTIRSVDLKRKSVFRLDMEVSRNEYVPYTCKEAVETQIGFILIEVFSLAVAIIVHLIFRDKKNPCRNQRQGTQTSTEGDSGGDRPGSPIALP